ncbi:MAG: LptA/OstA family protein [Steroidobacteraceae bacterium]
MAPSLLELLRRGRVAAAAMAVVAFLPATAWVAASRDDIDVEGHSPDLNLNAGTLSLRDVKLRQGPGTYIKADSTSATGIAEGYQNSRWEFRGAVHIEFDGAVLDADSAVAIFADSRIKSISVRGAPANFSHVLKDKRNLGRANNIDFDAASRDVHFAGKAWYSDGRNEATTDALTYNLDNRALTSTGNGNSNPDSTFRMTIRPDKPISLPRAPERSTAE